MAMAYRLKRIRGGGTMRVHVSQPADGEGGLADGGTFYFGPAGSEDAEQMASEHAARVIMSDPGMAPDFECTPPLASKVQKAPEQPAAETAGGGQDGPADDQPATKTRRR